MIARAARAALIAGLAAGCGASGAPRGAEPDRAIAAEAAPLGPARWVFTDRLGVSYDEGAQPSPLPRPELAVIDGVRVRVESGVALAWAPAAERISGFRSLPSRLGGGFVLWSEGRVYRAHDFFGELEAIVDAGASGGARPYLGSILLRSSVGLLEVDPVKLSVRRFAGAGVAEAIAIDDKRAVRVDAFGRASYTVDGGANFRDVRASLGHVITSAREQKGEILLTAEGAYGPSLVLGASGDLAPYKEPPTRRRTWPWSEGRTGAPLLGGLPGSSRSLPSEQVAHAIVAGALLSGGRMIVGRHNGLRVLSTETALPLADSDLFNVDARFGRCQVLADPPKAGRANRAGGAALLACVGDGGSVVLALDDALGHPLLEATFPEEGGFVAGPGGRLAFTGRCGPEPAGAADLGPGAARPADDGDRDELGAPTAAPQPIAPAATPSPDDARVCVRVDASHWIERRLSGGIARRLYRWVPGDDGTAIALLLGTRDDGASDDVASEKLRRRSGADERAPAGKDAGAAANDGDAGAAAAEEDRVGDGVRMIRVDPDDPALSGGAFAAVREPQRDAPFRSVEIDFWEEDGAVRGWLRLPAPGAEARAPIEPSPQGPAKRMLKVAAERGGRSAGVRIDAAGRVTVYPLPEGVTEVVTGGRFGLAMGGKSGEESWFETLDGGRTWTPIEAAPVGRVAPPPDDRAPFGCSALGCTWGAGLVRLGWGGPPPKPRVTPAMSAAKSPLFASPSPLGMTCRLDADREPWRDAPAASGAKAAASKAPKPQPPPAPPSRSKPAKPPPEPQAAKGASPGAKPRAAGKGAQAAKAAQLDPASPPLPISLRAPRSSAIGALREHTWTGDVLLPFQPSAAPKHLSVADKALASALGGVAPILPASPREPVDLLLVVDRRRLRARAPASSFAPLDLRSAITAAADGPGGVLVTLEAERGTVALARGDAVSSLLRVAQVADVSRSRLTLARRIEGGGLAIVGYSTSTGDVFAGDLDLAAAEVKPLVGLGRIDAMGEAGGGACAGAKVAYRFVAEVPVVVRLAGKGGAALFDGQVTASVLITASADRLCVEGIDAALPVSGATLLSATFARGAAAASVRVGAKATRAACSLDRRSPPAQQR